MLAITSPNDRNPCESSDPLGFEAVPSRRIDVHTDMRELLAPLRGSSDRGRGHRRCQVVYVDALPTESSTYRGGLTPTSMS